MSALLFVHGFGLDGRVWQRQVERFGGERTVLAPDLPGFGPRPADAGGVSAARAMLRACDDAGVGTFHLVGLSLGGAVAVDMALTFPERVQSLTLVDALLRGRPSGITAWQAAATLAKAGRMAEAARAWIADPVFDGARGRPAVWTELERMALDYRGAHWTGEASTTFEVGDPGSRLHEISVPSLVVVGADDLPAFRAMADEYAAGIPRARELVLDGVGHLACMEAPDAFNRALAEHLDGVDSPT